MSDISKHLCKDHATRAAIKGCWGCWYEQQMNEHRTAAEANAKGMFIAMRARAECAEASLRTTNVELEESIEDNNSLRAQLKKLKCALVEISEGKGAYDQDPLKHAANCIEDMKAMARGVLNLDEKE